MKVSVNWAWVVGAAAFGSFASAGEASAAQSCVANCNAANMQCSQANKDQTVCLRAWHQCKVGCSTSAAPPALTVTQPKPGTVVIKSAAPKPAKH